MVRFYVYPTHIIVPHQIILALIWIKWYLWWKNYVRVIQKFKNVFVLCHSFHVFFDKTLSLLVIRMCSIHTVVITRNSAMFWSITHILNSSILSRVRKRGIIWKCNSTVCSSCYTFEKDGWWKSSRLLDITYREKICSKNYRSIYLIDEIARHFSTVCSCINLWLLKLLKSTVWAQN